jgi:hypothetical protein
MTVDGTDFRIPEQGPTFSSHKYNMKSGFRYEVALCIKTGSIVWFNGPFACGKWQDITIFRMGLMTYLEEGERVKADDGYVGEAPRRCKIPKYFQGSEREEMMKYVRNRQETVNKRFKNWGILKQVYRNKEKIHLHGEVFAAIVVITQVAINNGERLFDVDYDDEL